MAHEPVTKAEWDKAPPNGRLLFDVYVMHLHGLAFAAAALCGEVFADTADLRKEGDGGFVRVDARLHAKIEAICTNVANIAKLIHLPPKTARGDTRAKQWRRLRARALNEAVGLLELPEIRKTEGRNAIEHFDQFLDRLSLTKDITDGGRYEVGLYNIVVSHSELVNADAMSLRYYAASERTYFVHGQVVKLGVIAEELESLLRALSLHLANEEPGGLFVRFTEEAPHVVDLEDKIFPGMFRERR